MQSFNWSKKRNIEYKPSSSNKSPQLCALIVMNEKSMPIPFYIKFVTTKNAIRGALPFERRLKDVQKTFKRRYVSNYHIVRVKEVLTD